MRFALLLFRITLLWCLAVALPGCIDPYMPEVISATKHYLVVDGFINSQGITTVILSRTYDIDGRTTPPAETGATVTIEAEGGGNYAVRESTTKGTYASASLRLPATQRYRLRIRTSGGKEYASDYVLIKTAPAIDNITWRTANDGLNIYVNTHDDTNASQYYRWEYEETWEIRPPYSPSVEYKNGRMQDITVPFPVTCWGNVKSVDIKISNTTRLSQDVVSDFPIRSFATTASQIYYKYSILVRQHTLTQEEYGYWELLKKNTENIGSLFDPQPAQLTGNVHCLNDDTELALGYVGAHSVAEKRIFISRGELPSTWRLQNGFEGCLPPDSVFLYKPSPPPPNPAEVLRSAFGRSTYLPIQPIYEQGIIIGYLAKEQSCIDCRARGASVRPSFWQ